MPTTQVTEKRNLLQKLPVELWLMIFSLLPNCSVAALSLTCQYMIHILGSSRQTEITSNQIEKYAFLRLIQDDYARHSLCKNCNILHLQIDAKGSRRPACLAKKPRPSTNTGNKDVDQRLIYLISKFWINWRDVYAAVAIHSAIPTARPKLDFLRQKHKGHHWSSATSAMVIQGSLLLRVESFMNLEWRALHMDSVSVSETNLPSCRHFRNWHVTYLDRGRYLRALEYSRLRYGSENHWEGPLCSSDTYERCDSCPSEYCCEVVPAESCGVESEESSSSSTAQGPWANPRYALKVTWYLDCGDGGSPLEPSREWLSLTVAGRQPHDDYDTVGPQVRVHAPPAYNRITPRYMSLSSTYSQYIRPASFSHSPLTHRFVSSSGNWFPVPYTAQVQSYLPMTLPPLPPLSSLSTPASPQPPSLGFERSEVTLQERWRGQEGMAGRGSPSLKRKCSSSTVGSGVSAAVEV